MSSTSRVILLALTLVATAFAGCLAPETAGETTISRIHTLTLTRETTERADDHNDDPAAALRELLTTDLVIRVSEIGDYTVEFTDAQGNPKTQTLTGATPVLPVTVTGADPISPVVLKKGGEQIAIRSGINALWWHAGDMPLGFNMTPGAMTKYNLRSDVRETFSLKNYDLPEQEMRVDEINFNLRLPMEGTASWQLLPEEADGAPLLLSGNFNVPKDAGDLVSLDLVATMNGEPGTAGIVGGVDEATASASAKFWIKDGQPAAAQFLGADVKTVPRATMWADGFFAQMADGSNCAGKTKADKCTPSELSDLENFERSFPSDDKETFSASDYPKVETDQEREALSFINRLFAQDIARGDKATIIMRADEEDFGGGRSGPRGDAMAQFTIEAVGLESVKAAGRTFQTIKIVEEMITRVNIADVPGPGETSLIKDYKLDETITRSTFWLDAETYQPVKMVTQMPFDAEDILKGLLNSIDPSAWDQVGGKPLTNDQWSLKSTMEASYEIAEFQPGTHMSALVGLALAHAASSLGGAPIIAAATSYVWITGFGTGATPYEYEQPAKSLSLASSGPAHDGVKSYTVAAASPYMSWYELAVAVDGQSLQMVASDFCYEETCPSECQMPSLGEFSVCSGPKPVNMYDTVNAGDTLTVFASPGSTLRILDTYANAVILTLTVS